MNNNLLTSVMRVKKNADKLKGGLLKLANKLEGGFRKKKTKNLKGGKRTSTHKSKKKSSFKKTEETIRNHYRRRYG